MQLFGRVLRQGAAIGIFSTRGSGISWVGPMEILKVRRNEYSLGGGIFPSSRFL